MGAQSHDLASKLLPLRGRHQEEAEERVRRVAANAAVLSGAAAAAAAPNEPFSAEDDADGVASFLDGITAQ